MASHSDQEASCTSNLRYSYSASTEINQYFVGFAFSAFSFIFFTCPETTISASVSYVASRTLS